MPRKKSKDHPSNLKDKNDENNERRNLNISFDLNENEKKFDELYPIRKNELLSPTIRRRIRSKTLVPDDYNEDLAAYIQNCKTFGIPVDPSICISLISRWEIAQPTKEFKEGSMLSLLEILEDNKYIKKLNLSGAATRNHKVVKGLGNSNCRVLHQILMNNKTIEELDISNNGLDDDGIREIAEGLKFSKSLKKLNLSSNNFGRKGSYYLRKGLAENNVIEELDISRNRLDFQSIELIRTEKNSKKRHVCFKVHGNFVFEEVLNALTHGIGFIIAIVGTIILLDEASEPMKTERHFWACFLFCISLLFTYLFSTLYHSFFMIPNTRLVFQRCDHSAIYLLIAGSYTPFLLINLWDHERSHYVLIAEWVMALMGVVYSIVGQLNSPITTAIELFFFLSMGFAGVVLGNDLFDAFPPEGLYLVIGGGFTYVFGIIFFIIGNWRPIAHTIWHCFVLAASIMHFFAIYFYSIPIAIGKDHALNSE